jgi:hypothetical protein
MPGRPLTCETKWLRTIDVVVVVAVAVAVVMAAVAAVAVAVAAVAAAVVVAVDVGVVGGVPARVFGMHVHGQCSACALSLLLSLPLSLPVVSPLPLSLPFDFRIALHSTACATSSHIISSHPSYLTLSFGHLLAGCCLLLLTRSPTPLLAHSITPSYCFLFAGKKQDVKHLSSFCTTGCPATTMPSERPVACPTVQRSSNDNIQSHVRAWPRAS